MKPFLLFLFIGFCLGCNEPKPPIPFPTLIHIIRDLHIAEAAVTTPGAPMYGQSPTDSMPQLNAMVLKRYGLQESDFRAGLAWYKQHPELLDSAYKLVLADLSVMQSDINK